jgi:23S rRNA pseudouridine1911/1915/1917 synthase
MIREGRVRVDQKPPEKTGQKIFPGQVIEVEILPPEPSELSAEKIELKIIFENEDVIVVDKPAGMVVHPSAGHAHGTLVNAVLGKDGVNSQINGEIRPGIVHRLDRDTSGLIVIAKNESSLQFLQEQFHNRKVNKTYLALVDGHPPSPAGRIETPIGRDPRDRKRMAVVEPVKGRQAVTEYKVIENFQDNDLLEVHPLTGRTHQIRVHLKFIHCPVSGDPVYGKTKTSLPINRQFLHAAILQIRLPGEDFERRFESSLPDDLQNTLEFLRKKEPLKS